MRSRSITRSTRWSISRMRIMWGIVQASFSVRHLARADFALLGGWLAAAHVARSGQHEGSPQAMEADFGAVIDGLDPADVFIVSLGTRPIGLLQRYTFADNPGYITELAHLVDAPGAALSIAS